MGCRGAPLQEILGSQGHKATGRDSKSRKCGHICTKSLLQELERSPTQSVGAIFPAHGGFLDRLFA